MNKKIVHIFIVILAVFSALIVSDFACSAVFAQTFEVPFLKGGDTTLGEVGDQKFSFPVLSDVTNLGEVGFEFILKRIIRYLQYVFGAIGVLYIFIAGYRLLVAGGGIEEEATKQKKNLQWIVIGFVVMTIADQTVNRVFFPKASIESFLQTEEATIMAAKEGLKLLRQVVDFFVAFVGTVAILTVVLSGMRIIMSPGNEEVINAQKKIFMWAAMGLIIITMADRIIYTFYGESGQRGINVRAGLVELSGIANYILGFLAVLAAASLIYAGILMIANYGNDEAVSKAKTVVKDTAIGLVVAFSSYTVVSAIVRLGG